MNSRLDFMYRIIENHRGTPCFCKAANGIFLPNAALAGKTII